MNFFSHKITGYENNSGYRAFKQFFDTYMLERDYEKTLSFLDEDFYSVGTGGDEVASSKEEFKELLRMELDVLPEPIEYRIKSIRGKEIAENVWDILAAMEVILPIVGKEKIVYVTRVTGCFKVTENGSVVLSAHISEPSGITEEKEFLPLKYISKNESIDKEKTEQIIFDIMSKSMPGGIISGYAEEGFPLYFVNDRYLELLGYSSYEEYYEAANGLGISHIHPDDVDMVNKETMYSYSMNTQYGIEYRIRHKDGHYINVYDIGRKMITPDNKEVIICVLYDMTEDAKLKEVLIRESSMDALTGVYNRGGGSRTIGKLLEYVDSYSFAFFDIDNLKRLNDEYNHAVGDCALQYFVKLLEKYCDEKSIFVRLGGDEFVAFINEKRSKQRIEFIFSKVEEEYCSFIAQNYPKSHSSVSAGCLTGTRKCSFDELCRKTDELMYDIKKNGKCGFKIVELD